MQSLIPTCFVPYGRINIRQDVRSPLTLKAQRTAHRVPTPFSFFATLTPHICLLYHEQHDARQGNELLLRDEYTGHVAGPTGSLFVLLLLLRLLLSGTSVHRLGQRCPPPCLAHVQQRLSRTDQRDQHRSVSLASQYRCADGLGTVQSTSVARSTTSETQTHEERSGFDRNRLL